MPVLAARNCGQSEHNRDVLVFLKNERSFEAHISKAIAEIVACGVVALSFVFEEGTVFLIQSLQCHCNEAGARHDCVPTYQWRIETSACY